MAGESSITDSITVLVGLAKRGECGTLIFSYEAQGIEPASITIDNAPSLKLIHLVDELKEAFREEARFAGEAAATAAAASAPDDDVARTAATAAAKTDIATKSLVLETADLHELYDNSGMILIEGSLWDIFCGGDADEDYSACEEEALTEWKPLVPNQSKVRIMTDTTECEARCRKVGNSWSSRVHHMNGNVYTVIQNLPPDKYMIYDPVCHANGLQAGKIFIPCAAVCAVLELQLVAVLSGVQRDDLGSLVFHFLNMAGAQLATVTAESDTSADVSWLRAALADVVGMKPHLVQILSPGGTVYEDAGTLPLEDCAGAEMLEVS